MGVGHALTHDEGGHLALPVVHFGGLADGSAAMMSDPTFSSLWEVSREDGAVSGVLRYRYLNADPLQALQGDPLPAAEAGLANWALAARGSRALASESQGRAVKVRVHDLPQPVEVKEFRLVVQKVAPADGRARWLQLEAWGPDGR
jgi:hypothetical protein